MGRQTTGKCSLAQAHLDAASAKTADQLRVALAVILPLEYGLTLIQTGEAIGKTSGWVARNRRRYINGPSERKNALPRQRGGRRNSLLSFAEEIYFVTEAVSRGKFWGSTEKQLQNLLKARLGRVIAISTAYKMVRRVISGNPEIAKVANIFDRNN